MMWSEKYRPQRLIDLIGNEEDVCWNYDFEQKGKYVDSDGKIFDEK